MQKECFNCHITLDEDEIVSKYNNVCPVCHLENSYEYEYIMDIKRISTDESFVQSMIKLHNEDPIEYQLKLNQFKLHQEQKDEIQERQRQENLVHCPYCNSTNLKRITTTAKAVNIAMFGLFGNKRKYQWHCNNCKTDF